MLQENAKVKFSGALFFTSFIAHSAILVLLFFRSNEDLMQVLGRGDGWSYLAVADCILSGNKPQDLFNLRVFPGWPIAFLPVYLLTNSLWGPILLGIILASLLPVFHYQLTGHKFSSTVMICGTPALLVSPAYLMSESLFLALIYLACLSSRSSKHYLAAIITGLTAWVRPVAFFLWCGQTLVLLQQKQYRIAITTSAIAGFAASSLFLFNFAIFQDPFIQFNQYGTLPNISDTHREMLGLADGTGSHSGLPFSNFIAASLRTSPPLWKQIFIWGHAICLCLILLWSMLNFKFHDKNRVLHCINATGMGLFIFSTGPYWAFYSFDRYFVWALPSYLILLEPWLPKRMIGAITICILCFGCALVAIYK